MSFWLPTAVYLLHAPVPHGTQMGGEAVPSEDKLGPKESISGAQPVAPGVKQPLRGTLGWEHVGTLVQPISPA